MRDDFYWFRVHDHIDEHPKIEPLSDGAFRLVLETWAYCRRNANDGRIDDAVWRKRSKPKARRELADAGLVEQRDGFVQVHDYLDWQQSAAEIDEARAKKSKAGALGNHKKWHTDRGRFDPSCEFCAPPPTDGSDPSHVRSQMRSQERSHLPRKRIAEVEGERELTGYVDQGGHVTNASDPNPPFPDHCPWHAHDPIPPPCGRCKETREANARRAGAEQLPDYRLRVVQPLCGQCDDRWIDTPDGYVHCPRCHPAEVRPA